MPGNPQMRTFSQTTLTTRKDGRTDGQKSPNDCCNPPPTLCGEGLIGASLSEPHINGTSMRELYIYMWYVDHVGIIASYGHKRENYSLLRILMPDTTTRIYAVLI